MEEGNNNGPPADVGRIVPIVQLLLSGLGLISQWSPQETQAQANSHANYPPTLFGSTWRPRPYLLCVLQAAQLPPHFAATRTPSLSDCLFVRLFARLPPPSCCLIISSSGLRLAPRSIISTNNDWPQQKLGQIAGPHLSCACRRRRGGLLCRSLISAQIASFHESKKNELA